MDAVLEARSLALLVVASAAFTLLSPAIYRRDPTRRKLYLVTLALALLLVPWWSLAGFWTWPVGVDQPDGWLAEPVPRFLLWTWWSVGALLMLRSGGQVALGRRRLQALPPFADPATASMLPSLANELALRRPVSQREGPAPCASTLGPALLVLPDAARRWSADTRRAVLGHELAHIRRQDDRLLLLMRLLLDWYWWMPWLRSLHRRYVEAMEESCDDAATRLVGDRRTYVAGLVDAARSLRRPADTAAWPASVSLLGHTHLTVRAERLLTRPRPTLDQADGRWALLGSSLLLALLLTARPTAIPARVPDSAELYPLRPAPAAAVPLPHLEALWAPRVEVSTFIEDWQSGTWRALPASARDPMPVYPARAFEQGLEGTVTVEMDVTAGPSGWYRRSTPRLSSSDPSGLLAGAVERALARTGSDLSAGLRALSAHHGIDRVPPGTRLRLRKAYRFVLALRLTEGPATPPATTQSHHHPEVAP